MLLHLPNGHDAESVRDALIVAMADLPAHLRGSLTWDQGAEMARHKQFSVAADMAVTCAVVMGVAALRAARRDAVRP